MPEQDRPLRGAETLTRPAAPELIVDMPLAGADLVAAKAPDQPALTEADIMGTGRLAPQAQGRMHGMVDPGGVGAMAAQVASRLHHVQDELTDAQAMQLRGRRQEIAAGAVVGEAVPERPREPTTLPDVLRSSVFDPNRKTTILPVAPEWLTIYDLPRYMQAGIRALGRSVFDMFPCYERHKESATRTGDDALGSVQLLASFQGTGPSRQSELDVVATWIRANGVPIEATALEFPVAIPGYRPRIILCTSEDRSYLMVDEKRENGAPADAMFIYSWVGGQTYYLDTPDAMKRVARLAAPRLAIPAPAGAVAAAPPMRPAPMLRRPEPRPVAQVDAEISAMQVAPPDVAKRKKVLASLEQAPVAANTLATDIRRSGFRPFGAQITPTFRKELPDGRAAVITGQEGVPAVQAASFTLTLLDAHGVTERVEEISTLEEIETALATDSAPRP